MLYLINPQPFSETILRTLAYRFEPVYGRYIRFSDITFEDAYTRAVHQLVQLAPTRQKGEVALSIISAVEQSVKCNKITVALAIWSAEIFKTVELIFYTQEDSKNITKYIRYRKPFLYNISYNILGESTSFIIDGVQDINEVLKHTQYYVKNLLDVGVTQ